jgi:hypothetical protein
VAKKVVECLYCIFFVRQQQTGTILLTGKLPGFAFSMTGYGVGRDWDTYFTGSIVSSTTRQLQGTIVGGTFVSGTFDKELAETTSETC